MHSRLVSSLSFLPARRSRWALALLGLVFLAQGLGKALDPSGYMTALDAFHVLRPGALAPLSLGALALSWTVVELLAGVALLYGGLSRAPAKQLTLAGLMLALGLTAAYLALASGAHGRGIAVANVTCFGTLLAQRLTWVVVLEEALLLASLAWLFTLVLRWPSLEHVTERARPRALSHA